MSSSCAGRILVLHPVQDVASFLQSFGRAPLSGVGLIGIAALLILGLAHVIGRTRQALERLLEAWIGQWNRYARIGSAGLGFPRLALLTCCCSGLALLACADWKRIAAARTRRA